MNIWHEREHWHKSEGWELKKEIWDGNRWAELKWFWDPNCVWALPTHYVYCDFPISADHLTNSLNRVNLQSNIKIVECPICLSTLTIPLN